MKKLTITLFSLGLTFALATGGALLRVKAQVETAILKPKLTNRIEQPNDGYVAPGQVYNPTNFIGTHLRRDQYLVSR